MDEVPAKKSIAKTSGQKNILFNHETILIIGAIIAAIVLLSLFFSVLWAYFKLGFVCLLSFLLIVITRKTDSWKFGVECFYFLTFLLSYAFSPFVAILVVTPALLTVVKFFRPDELEGAITQIIATTGMAFTTHYLLFAHYGLEITQSQLMFAGVVSFVVWDFVRMLVALKIAPAHWVKIVVSLVTGAFINYFYYSTFAFTLLQFFLSI